MTRKDNVVFAIERVEARSSDIHSLERRMSDYCETLKVIMIQLRIPFEEPDTQKIQTWYDIATDFQFIYIRFSDQCCAMGDVLADLMITGLAHERHERLLRLMGVGRREQTTMPSPIEGISELGRIGMALLSISGELQHHHVIKTMR